MSSWLAPHIATGKNPANSEAEATANVKASFG